LAINSGPADSEKRGGETFQTATQVNKKYIKNKRGLEKPKFALNFYIAAI
jgi:hypothetical protein